MLRRNLGLIAGFALVATGANAATQLVGINPSAALDYHTYYAVGGANGAAPSQVYGDGALAGISPNNMCVDNPHISTGGTDTNGRTCAQAYPANTPPVAANTYVNGSNGAYWTGNLTPTASYGGTIQYDNAITFVDAPSGDTYFRVTGGTLSWTGSYGIEVVTNPGPASPYVVGGSFFGYSFNNSSINLATGARATGSSCFLGAAGAEVVGSLLCGFANPLSSYGYANTTGTTPYTKSADWAGVRFNPDGTMHLLLTSNKFSATGSGNNIREELNLVPVPAAAWLFGSAAGLLGWMRRKVAV